MNMQPLVTYWSSPGLFLKSKSASCADTQCIHLPYFIMLSAQHDLVGTKGNKLGGGCCSWVVVLAFFFKIIFYLCKYCFPVGVFFTLGSGECIVFTCLSCAARGSQDRPNSSLTPGWITSGQSWKEVLSLNALPHAIPRPSTWQHGILNA